MAVAALAGCSQALPTPLPDPVSDSRHLLSDSEQKRVIEEMNLERERHQSEAIKEIEQQRAAEPAATPAATSRQPLTSGTQ